MYKFLNKRSPFLRKKLSINDLFMDRDLEEEAKDSLLEKIRILEEKECVVALPNSTGSERKKFLALMLDRFELPTLTCIEKKSDSAVCIIAGANSLKKNSHEISSTFSSLKIDFARNFLENPFRYLGYSPAVEPKPENIFVGSSIYTALDKRSLGLASRALSISLDRAREIGAAYYIEGYSLNPLDHSFQRVLDKLDFISPVIEIASDRDETHKVFDMKWVRTNETLGISMVLRVKDLKI